MLGSEKMRHQFFKFSLLFLFLSVASSSPPQDPIKCSSGSTNCTVMNTYGAFPDRSTCKAAEAFYPTSEKELISIVASATKSKRKIKVVTPTYHSVPKLACTDGQDGVLISTKHLNRVLKIDRKAMKMTVEPGLYIRDLINEAAAAGLALPCTPYWWGLTIGGAISTAAHGSSWWGKGSAVHEHVAGLRIVSPAGPTEGYAKVRTIKEGDEDLKAAQVSLGVLGAISQVTLQLVPLFKRSITYMSKNDTNFEDEVVSFGHQHTFGDITWFPSQRKVLYRVDDIVSANTSGNGLNVQPSFGSFTVEQVEASRTTEEIQEATGDVDGKCANASSQIETGDASGHGLTNNGTTFTGYPVIGYNNRMETSGACLNSTEDTYCSWDPRVKGSFFFFTAYAIRFSLIKNFIRDVRKLVQLQPKSLCGVELYGGLIFRYIKASEAYLGKPYDVIDVDIAYYRSTDPTTPRLFEDIIEEIEQIAVFKYGGIPHWGKNRIMDFEGAIHKYKNAYKFLQVKRTYDPSGLFSNEWTDQILGLKKGLQIVKDGCALEGNCICSQDSHCAPSKGYFCRPGKVYKEARVCTLLQS